MKKTLLIIVSLLAVSCSPTPQVTQDEEVGGLHQKCAPSGTCRDELVCNEFFICVEDVNTNNTNNTNNVNNTNNTNNVNLCGNGVIDDGEVCDGTNLTGETCESQGHYEPGVLRCSSDCLSFDTGLCAGTCGDGIQQSTHEMCDGTDLGFMTCKTQGFSSGEVSCNNDCTVNTDLCECESCGEEDVCYDLQSDVEHCGSCWIACDTGGGETCGEGQCVKTCGGEYYDDEYLSEPGHDCWGIEFPSTSYPSTYQATCYQECCNGSLITTSSSTGGLYSPDTNNCGGCGIQCESYEMCEIQDDGSAMCDY